MPPATQILAGAARNAREPNRRNTLFSRASIGWHLLWFGAVSIGAFLIPCVFSSMLGLQHDLYYLVYFVGTLAALGAYVRASEADLLALLRRGWRASLVIGVLAAAFVVWSVLGRIDPTPHPAGAYFAFEIAWRGLIYGVVDALLLSAFPGLVAFNIFERDVVGGTGRVRYGALTFLLVMIITGAYHAGYAELRNRPGMIQPEVGNTIISLPVIITMNPIGSVVAHTSMHLAAVTHAYESKDRLPPRTSAK